MSAQLHFVMVLNGLLKVLEDFNETNSSEPVYQLLPSSLRR